MNAGKKKINVFPKKGYEDHSTNQDPEVDNYSCIRFLNKQCGDYLISFNGHMCKRTQENLQDGMNPLMALDLTLLTFRGAIGDARIGCVNHLKPNGISHLYLGVNDIERGEKRVSRYPNQDVSNLENKILFIYDKDTSFQKIHQIAPDLSLTPDGFAQYLPNNVIGEEILFGLSTGVAILAEKEPQFGIYNNCVNQDRIENWYSQLRL